MSAPASWGPRPQRFRSAKASLRASLRSSQEFEVKTAAIAGAATLIGQRRAYAQWAVQSQGLRKFVQPLRTLGQMAPASSVSSYAGIAGSYPGVDYYEIAMRQFTDKLHPDLGETKLWGYGNAGDGSFRHLGGAIVAKRGTAVRVRFVNDLPDDHILPVDVTVPGAGATVMAMHNRAAVHLHGGHVPWPSDGGPFHWFTTSATGPSVVPGGWLPDSNNLPTNDYWYPNDQSARLMWYHDHAVGNTRLNAYAGLATAYIIRDAAEADLIASGAIPASEMPLVFQDKIFKPGGHLWYPDTYNQLFFGPPLAGGIPPTPSLNPEFWGDTILANGTVSPFVEVEPKRYRFRVLNACNTRFMSLRLMYAVGKSFPDETEPDMKNAGPPMQLIGTEGGFLDPAVNPQGVMFTAKTPLVLAPGERADIVIDFSKVKPGQPLILYNDAPVPFPGGTPLADFYPGNSKLAVPPLRGFTPDTRSVLQFRVTTLKSQDTAPRPAGGCRRWIRCLSHPGVSCRRAHLFETSP